MKHQSIEKSGLAGLSELVRDLVRQMLRLRWDDTTIVFHLKSAKIRNAQKILDSVLDEAKKEAIARLTSRNRYVR